MHRSQSAETRGSKGMSPLNRRFAPPIRGCWPSQRIRISNLCPLLFLDSDYLDRLLFKEGWLRLNKNIPSLAAQTGWLANFKQNKVR